MGEGKSEISAFPGSMYPELSTNDFGPAIASMRFSIVRPVAASLNIAEPAASTEALVAERSRRLLAADSGIPVPRVASLEVWARNLGVRERHLRHPSSKQ